MSPIARKTKKEGVKRTEWSVRGKGEGFGNKYVKLRIDGTEVRITWLDGTSCATRTFTAARLREHLLYLKGPASQYPEVWFHLEDISGKTFYLRLSDGQLTANEENSENGFVEWEALEHAIEEALTELEADDSPQQTERT